MTLHGESQSSGRVSAVPSVPPSPASSDAFSNWFFCSVPAQHLALPHLLFCNRFPFTQVGLASLGAQFNRDFVLAYLRQWY
ncbi:hypothetical protein niasHT_036608 [Heterodera trifolii]|uniref:Uncharacterized protein n=1 Tax=Heterodera trifolii TaxID=157864 RepID=A0ABD2I1Y9_9BILA